jgi:hypothetical protein
MRVVGVCVVLCNSKKRDSTYQIGQLESIASSTTTSAAYKAKRDKNPNQIKEP